MCRSPWLVYRLEKKKRRKLFVSFAFETPIFWDVCPCTEASFREASRPLEQGVQCPLEAGLPDTVLLHVAASSTHAASSNHRGNAVAVPWHAVPACEHVRGDPSLV